MNLKENSIDAETLNNLREGVFVFDFDWKYIYVNDAGLKLAKYENKDELIGSTIFEKFPGIENTPIFKHFTDCMENRIEKTVADKYTFPDRTVEWFEMRFRPVPKGLQVLSVNITDKVILDEASKTYTKTLERTLFLLSHELRHPICTIQSLIDTINDTGDEKILEKVLGFLNDEIRELDIVSEKLVNFIVQQKIDISNE